MRLNIRTSLLILVACVATTTAAHAEQWTKNFTVGAKAELRLETTDGNVTVRAGEGKAIHALVTTTGWRIGPEEVRVTDRQSGDRVELQVRLPLNHWNVGTRSVRIEVTVPREADLEIHTGDGNITADGVRGQLRFTTGDGNIRASSLQGTLDASTGDGNMNVEGRFDRLNLKSGDGRVDAQVNSGSKMTEDWSVRSGDGDVTLRLPEDFSANLSLHTGDGHIQLDFPRTVSGSRRESDVHGKLNGGGPVLTVHTGDGSIHLQGKGQDFVLGKID